jgi:glycosyltransferase involved in cell wall biosynthesis
MRSNPMTPSSNPKIRVLYFQPSLDFHTGSPRALASFIESLDCEVFEPLFCAATDGPLVEALRARGVGILRGGGHTVRWRHPWASVAAIRRQARQLKSWRIDVLHAHGFFWNTDLILAAWAIGIPVVLHAQNPITVDYRNLVRFAARKVLFCSNFEMANTHHFHRIAGKTEVLHNVMDADSMGRGVSIRAQLGLKDGQLAIGTVAQVGRRKGIDILIETARLVLRERPEAVFLVAGPGAVGEDEFGAGMRALADAPDLRGRMRFLGPRSDIPDFLASLDLFVLPTRAEPFGIVVIEAMAAKVPVVASKVGGIPEIVSSPEIGSLVDPLTPEAFAAAICEILARPDRGRLMADAARLSATRRFGLAAAGKQLKRIYLELLPTTRRGPTLSL